MNNHKIELLASANWSKINWDLSWQSVIELAEILPKVGQSYEITLQDSEADHTKNGIYHLLWLPPHSELNGLDDRSTEVLKAHVIEAELTQGKWLRNGSSFGLERQFTAKVISVSHMMQRISKILITQGHEVSHYFTIEPYRVCFYQWDRLCLLTLQDQYQFSELLFYVNEEQYFLIFVNNWVSYWYESYICYAHLDIQQIEIIKKYLIPSNRGQVWMNDELRDHQVQGAAYM